MKEKESDHLFDGITMNVGDALIVTHDHTGHGIPLGKVVAVMSRCQYIIKVYNPDYGMKYVEMDDVTPLLNAPEGYEEVCMERDYERFWLNFKLIGYTFGSIVLAVIGMVFIFDEPHVFTNYLVAFVTIASAFGLALAGRKFKREEELNIFKEIR